MAKRASESSLKGSRGQTAVKRMFEDLDWGPVPVPEHDDGTDSSFNSAIFIASNSVCCSVCR